MRQLNILIKLAKIAKISTRTLRYYDEIDLLKPHRINKSGYRIYRQVEIVYSKFFFIAIWGLPLVKLSKLFQILISVKKKHCKIISKPL